MYFSYAMKASSNFAFLREHDVELVRLGTLAERSYHNDPVACLFRLRVFGEFLAKLVAARVGLYEDTEESQVQLLNRLRDRGIIHGQIDRLFHELRKTGNRAVHDSVGDRRTALSILKYAHQLGIWFHRTWGKAKDFVAPEYCEPTPPEVTARQLESALVDERSARTQAEQLAAEIAQELQTALQHLAEIQAQQAQNSEANLKRIIPRSQAAAAKVELDEQETRRLIDTQLQDVGWEVDSEELTYGKGVRPVRGRNLAIAEYPTRKGAADYALFVGLQLVGIIEAKRESKDVSGAIDQAHRYARSLRASDNLQLAKGAPWGDIEPFQVPFVFATNGRPYLAQLDTKSGIWFRDVRRATNQRRAIAGWYSPEGLIDLLEQDFDRAHEQLAQEQFNYGFDLRHYQIKAITAIESALQEDRRSLLLAMATGTGKTKTCIALIYRLLKTHRFRRILFLVDRTSLGHQAIAAFKETKMESLEIFTDIYEVKELKDASCDRETKVHVATVQSFVRRIMYPSDSAPSPNVDDYDCVLIDECHRGYLLDRELSTIELEFRDFEDYVSKYRRVVEYFDAVRIGITATPALHTSEIFGEPIFQYTYAEAVIDKFLIDYESPHLIQTELAQSGIVWEKGAEIEVIDPRTGKRDLSKTADEVKVEIKDFNKKVITPAFNRVVCEYLAEQIDPVLAEKTLIFCATDDHADLVVKLLKEALIAKYGEVEDEAVQKITGASDRPLELIKKYRNEQLPKIAVTVDLLTTGIDVPKICNIVFLRRVNSRILFEQMLGRATRPCTEIGKDRFRVFDAVNIFGVMSQFTEMKPVAVIPKISCEKLVQELTRTSDPRHHQEILPQLFARIQRKMRRANLAKREQLEAIAGLSLEHLLDDLRASKPSQLANWFRDRPDFASVIDLPDDRTMPVFISYHPDRLVAVQRGYGVAEDGSIYSTRPDEYLQLFQKFLADNLNLIPALMVAVQSPKDLTRAQLKELQMLLEENRFRESDLQGAWRDRKNEDIAASIIGFIRQAAIGDALIPYSDRVDRAVRKIMSSRAWTAPQRQLLERIGKQLKAETIVDREALDRGAFKTEYGGFVRLNRTFNGELLAVLESINEEIWQDMG
ncbi:MAG: hypothetical protein RLZZ139_2783 [Cyanobacteriota bacterium]|jgi:type I restriction enzyme R subunit